RLEDFLKGLMVPALKRGDAKLTGRASGLLVMGDHGFRAANVTGQDHGVSLLQVSERKESYCYVTQIQCRRGFLLPAQFFRNSQCGFARSSLWIRPVHSWDGKCSGDAGKKSTRSTSSVSVRRCPHNTIGLVSRPVTTAHSLDNGFTARGLRLHPLRHPLPLIEATPVMSTDQKIIGASQEAPRISSRPAGTGTAASAAYVIALSSVAAVGGFLFGFDSGVINGAVD